MGVKTVRKNRNSAKKSDDFHHNKNHLDTLTFLNFNRIIHYCDQFLRNFISFFFFFCTNVLKSNFLGPSFCKKVIATEEKRHEMKYFVNSSVISDDFIT